MNEGLLSFAVDKSREMGCEYSEAWFQTTRSLVCSVRNGTPEPAVIINAAGIGVRVFCNGILAFGATNMISKESLSTLLQTLIKNTKALSPLRKKKSEFSQERTHVEKWRTEEKKKLEDMSSGGKQVRRHLRLGC